MTITPRTGALALALMTAALAGCAGLPAARMALPETLAALNPEPLPGIGAGRSGRFALDGGEVRFERGRDRLELFSVASFDRSPVRYTWARRDGSRIEAACRGRQDSVTLGVLQGQTRPFTFSCAWQPAAQLTLSAPSWIPGTRAERRGRYTAGGLTLELQSVHRVQGSPLPLEQPIGYVFTHEGRAVGAIELNGPTPRLWRPAPADPMAAAVTQAALALALLWDPSGAAP